MSQQTIGLGTAANDGTGDSLRVAGGKINANFTELYAGVLAGAASVAAAKTILDTQPWRSTQVINLNAASAPTAATGTGLQLVGSDGVVARYEADSFGAIAAFTTRRANGTGALPSALQSGDQIGGFNFYGYGETAYSGIRASLAGYATQNWTDSAQGTKLVLRTTPNNSIVVTDAVTIDQDQSVTLAGALHLPTKTANTVYAGPTTGSAAEPAFRSLVAADIPSLTASKISDLGSLATLNAAPAGTLTGTTLASNVVTSSLTSIGTLIAGVIATSLLTGTLQAAQHPALAGDVTSVAGALATTLATAQPGAHTWAAAQTFTLAPVFTDAPGSRSALGLGVFATSTDAANLTGTVASARIAGSYTGITAVGTLAAGAVPASLLTGTLAAGQFPALTGDVTTSAGSLATAIGSTKVTSAMLNADVFSTAHSWGGQQTLTNPILTTPTLGVAAGTSLALGGATIGSNALAVTGTVLFTGDLTQAASKNIIQGDNSVIIGRDIIVYNSTVGALAKVEIYGGTNPGLYLSSDSTVWFGSTTGFGVKQSSLSQASAGVLQVGTTAANALGSINLTNLTATGTVTVPGAAAAVLKTAATVTSGAGASSGTLTNAPSVGNPTSWIPFNDNGTTRYIPAW